MKHHWLSRPNLFLAILVLALAAFPVHGQDQPATAEPAVHEPISLQDLPREAADALEQAREIQEAFESSRLLATIERDLGGLRFELNEDEVSLSQIDLETLSMAGTQRFLATWKAHDTRVSSWQDELEEQWKIWIDGRERLTEESQRWEHARSQVVEDEELAASLGERTSEVIKAIGDIEQRLKVRIERLLEVSDRAEVEERRIAEAIGQIEEVTTDSFTRLRQRDGTPLWQLSRHADLAEGLFPLLRESVSDELAYALDYLSGRPGRVAGHAFFFAFLLISFVALRRRSKAWSPQDEVLRLSRHVLTRPLASALVLSLLATSKIYPDAPSAVVGLALLLSIVPVWRLLPELAGPALRLPVLAFLLLFSLNIARNLTFHEESLRRFALLGVTLLACGLAAWSLARLREQHTTGEGLASVLLKLILVAGGSAMAIATVANSLGWVQLAEFLTHGSLVSVYVGLVILVGFFIASGLIRAFPDTPTGQYLRTITRHRDLVTTRALRLVGIVALVTWIQAILRRFHLRTLARNQFSELLDSELTLGALEVSVGRVFSALTILFVGYLLARLVRFILAEEILSRFDIRLGVTLAVATMAYYVIFTTGAVGAASALGLGTENLTLMVSALGIGIGFGLQNVVANFVSGLILIFERPVKVGDLVEVGAILGEVGRIGIRASTIRTFEGAEVVVPNSDLVSKQVTNWTLSDLQRRRDFEVCVSWGTDPDEVIELLQETVNRNEKVLSKPAPIVYFRGYDGGDLRFSLFFWTPIEGSLGTLSDVGLEVNRALVGAGIEVAMPNRDVRIRGSLTTTEASPKTLPRIDPPENQ